MKTEKPIEFSLTVHPVYLGSHYVNNGTSATVSGWGYTTHPGDVASDLQWIAVQVIDNNECKNRMSESNAAKVFDSSLCAQSTDQAGGACKEIFMALLHKLKTNFLRHGGFWRTVSWTKQYPYRYCFLGCSLFNGVSRCLHSYQLFP